MTSYAAYVLETLLTLVAVCGLAVAVLWGARRLGVGRARGPVALLGHLPIDARRAVYVVRVGKQVLVVGASEAGLTRLGEVAAADLEGAADAGDAGPSGGFAAALARAAGRGGGGA